MHADLPESIRRGHDSRKDRLFPAKEGVNPTRRQNIIADILRVYEINDRGAFPSIKGTAYNLLNAVIEYTDHERSVRGGGSESELAKNRSESALFGSGEQLKQKAVEVIYNTVAKDGSYGSSSSLLDSVIANS